MWQAVGKGRTIIEDEFIVAAIARSTLIDGLGENIVLIPVLESRLFHIWERGVTGWMGVPVQRVMSLRHDGPRFVSCVAIQGRILASPASAVPPRLTLALRYQDPRATTRLGLCRAHPSGSTEGRSLVLPEDSPLISRNFRVGSSSLSIVADLRPTAHARPCGVCPSSTHLFHGRQACCWLGRADE